jgi:flagellin
MIQIADKAMEELSNIIDIIKQKAMQMVTDTTSQDGKIALKKDIEKLLDNYDLITDMTNYNGTQLIHGCEDFHFNLGTSNNDITLTTESICRDAVNLYPPFEIPVVKDDLVGGDGVIKVNFAWSENADIDAWITDPNGEQIGYGVADQTSTGGDWDVDDLGFGTGLSDDPNQENFVWETTAPEGTYQYYIKNRSASDTNVTVYIKAGESITTKNIMVPASSDSSIYTFEYDTKFLCNCESTTDVWSNDLKLMGNNLLSLTDYVLTKLNDTRASFGSTQNQLESSIRYMQTTHNNLKNAESVIRDVDYAQESANFSKLKIISQAGSYAMTQANKTQQNITNILK